MRLRQKIILYVVLPLIALIFIGISIFFFLSLPSWLDNSNTRLGIFLAFALLIYTSLYEVEYYLFLRKEIKESKSEIPKFEQAIKDPKKRKRILAGYLLCAVIFTVVWLWSVDFQVGLFRFLAPGSLWILIGGILIYSRIKKRRQQE